MNKVIKGCDMSIWPLQWFFFYSILTILDSDRSEERIDFTMLYGNWYLPYSCISTFFFKTSVIVIIIQNIYFTFGSIILLFIFKHKIKVAFLKIS